MTTAPNDGLRVPAADQPQSLSVIAGPGRRVRPCRFWHKFLFGRYGWPRRADHRVM